MSDLNAMDLEQGQTVGGYVLLSRLGGGAMGSVWRVRDGGGQEFAMKILRDSLSEDSDPSSSRNQATARERLRREAMALRRIRHPGVCRIVDMELDDALAFIVTELVEGQNLRNDVKQNGPYHAVDLERLAERLMDAVQAVHAAGIIHRDIKPTNVMVAATGPVLVDFGIAMGAGESHVTRTGLVMGTPGFIAPEIIEGAESDETTDWWSVASVLAFAATGRPVFGTSPMMTVLQREASGSADLSGIAENTRRALARALDPRRAQRGGPRELLDSISSDSLDDPTRALPSGDASPTEAMPPFEATSRLPRDPADTADAGTRTLWLPLDSTRTRGLPTGEADAPTSATRVLPAVVAAPGALDDGHDADAPASSRDQDDGSETQTPSSQDDGDLLWRHDHCLRTGGITIIGLSATWTLLAAAIPVWTLCIAAVTLWILTALGEGRRFRFERQRRHAGRWNHGDTALRVVLTPWHILTALPRALAQTTILGVITALVAVLTGPLTSPDRMGLLWRPGNLSIPLLLPSGRPMSFAGLTLGLSMGIAWIVVACLPMGSLARLGSGSWGRATDSSPDGSRRSRRGSVVPTIIGAGGLAVALASLIPLLTWTSILWYPLPVSPL
ncbi:serine/threonine-protein kinase [uncultured Bifidobacterium sp.]|uniref:serine/threonine-protein kinase n=1 Tax=uncultured Bifidobacterium sp. TaxID=165187 RepID=UPI0028DB7E07|nr:serine/threonine-protein kinase [uncultured Bifidobacterium sp.]